jgi:hypothetical protein
MCINGCNRQNNPGYGKCCILCPNYHTPGCINRNDPQQVPSFAQSPSQAPVVYAPIPVHTPISSNSHMCLMCQYPAQPGHQYRCRTGSLTNCQNHGLDCTQYSQQKLCSARSTTPRMSDQQSAEYREKLLREAAEQFQKQDAVLDEIREAVKDLKQTTTYIGREIEGHTHTINNLTNNVDDANSNLVTVTKKVTRLAHARNICRFFADIFLLIVVFVVIYLFLIYCRIIKN